MPDKKDEVLNPLYIQDFYSNEVDPFLRVKNSPSTRQKPVTAYEFADRFNQQSSIVRAGDVKATNMVKLSSDIAGTVSSLANNSSVAITITLTPQTTFKQSRAIGIPIVSMYEGTSIDDITSAFQIYPKQGGSVAYTDWRFVAGNDWGSSDNNNIVHQIVVANESGTVKSFVIIGNLRYMFNNAGKEQ